MSFAEVLSGCVYGTTGYVATVDDLTLLEQVVVANLPVLDTFDQVVVATNYAEGSQEELRRANALLWQSLVPGVVLIDSPRNRGHSIGTCDLDNMLMAWCAAANRRWLCKSANDILLSPDVLEIEVEPSQFYFINAVSFDAISAHEFDLDAFQGEFFYPQGTFWVMDTEGSDHLAEPDFLDASWRIVNRIDDYNGRIWEYLPGWSCEYLLRQAVLRRGLARQSLLTAEQWRHVLELTVTHRITDCSLKGVKVAGVCHVQGLTDPFMPWAVVD